MTSTRWLIVWVSVGALGLGCFASEWLRSQIGPGLTLVSGIALFVVAAIAIFLSADRVKSDSRMCAEAQTAVEALRPLHGSDRVRSISLLHLPETLTDYEAGQVLGDLTESDRVRAIEALAHRLRGLAKTGYTQTLGNLDGSYRTRAIETITSSGTSIFQSLHRF